VQSINGVVQRYAWGDLRFIPELLGRAPDGRPWAELWLGTHPSGPSALSDGRPLSSVAGNLPYLLKVLAAAEPLSLQTHPNAEQAASGFQAGKFVDPYPKPELLCALTPFEAFCGARPLDETVAVLEDIGLHSFADAVEHSGIAGTLEALLRRRVKTARIIDACRDSDRPEARWVVDLGTRYPDDPSVVATLLLNYVQLEPGEAIQLGPGNLHSYLGGAGIELMGASDNVVRAGLTSKPVEVDTLLDIVDTSPLLDPVLSPATRYPLTDTSISLLRLVGPASRLAKTHELIVTMSGLTGYLAPGETYEVSQGDTAFVATA
jgi:mannose-6-phosphate isomerase